MNITTMSSRERMLAAIDCKPVDHAPCSFMLYKGLLSQSRDYLDFLRREMDLGLDAYVQLPPRQPRVVTDTYNLHGLPVSFRPEVKVNEWKERRPEERWPILVKEYQTPAGTLRAEVYQDDEWPYGDHVPFLDDYIENRAKKFLINRVDELEALDYLLIPPTEGDAEEYYAQSQPAIDFARRNDLLLAGGWGVGADLIGWVYGLQRMMYAVYDEPEMLQGLLSRIERWNHSRMELVLSSGIDLYIKRAWYENCDFWSPRSWRSFILPMLRSDVDLAHAHGARFGYLITANVMPVLDDILSSGVDVLIGVDPARWDLEETRQKTQGKTCLWGGVTGHTTVEQGAVDEVRAEVRRAMDVLAPGGGFILSPVDNVRDLTEHARANVQALIQEWKNVNGDQ